MASSAIQAAQEAADKAFDEYLGKNCAATHVPDSVIRAAQIAYAMAGGQSAIKVVGSGNRTHPVCGVRVFPDNTRQAKLDLAAALESAAREIKREGN